MDLSSPPMDGITELLVKIIQFTQARQKLLMQNINNIHSPAFQPKDLAVDQFSRLLNQAVMEYAASNRLVFRDTANITFGSNGSFQARPLADEQSKALLEKDQAAYLQLQVDRMLENALNGRLATEMLSQRDAATPVQE